MPNPLSVPTVLIGAVLTCTLFPSRDESGRFDSSVDVDLVCWTKPARDDDGPIDEVGVDSWKKPARDDDVPPVDVGATILSLSVRPSSRFRCCSASERKL